MTDDQIPEDEVVPSGIQADDPGEPIDSDPDLVPDEDDDADDE